MMTRLLILAAILAVLQHSTSTAGEPAEKVPFIFDTDIGNDVDDVLALGMIHALQSRGECELLAVTITKDHEHAAAFTDAVNTFYGRGDIPVGVCRSGVTPQAGKFNGLAVTKDGDDFRFRHDLLSGKDAPDAVDVLRRALAGQKDGSVVVAQVGFSTNLAALLTSTADAHSPLNGVELVKRKVRLLSIMAGAFTQIPGKGGQLYDHKEYNIVKDIPAAQMLATSWPTPIIWSGFEIGISLAYPHQSIERDYRYVTHHPLAEAYVLYNPPPHDRPTWDLTSVLYGIRPDHSYFDVSEPGTATVADDGLTTFQNDAVGKHRYLIINQAQKLRTLEALQLLSSQPPDNTR
ncbi:MAG: nucleoside hydrolase [Rhodopirellula sp.]|nr:nucleoside hydrolase [Rhodopirellula sp.]